MSGLCNRQAWPGVSSERSPHQGIAAGLGGLRQAARMRRSNSWTRRRGMGVQMTDWRGR